MRISIVDGSYAKITSDKGDSLVFDISFYNSTGMEINNSLFTELNSFLELLDDRKRNDLFVLYSDILGYIKNTSRSDTIEMPLRELIAIIYEIIGWDELYLWMRNNRKITYPDNLKDNHDSHEQSRDKTYLRSDYFNLAVFAIWLRPMVPIWGSYIPLVEAESGAARKEYVAFRLLANTQVIYNHVLDRLSTYIESMDDFPALDKINTVAITGSLSSAETLTWLLNTTVVRRISCGTIDADHPKGHLVSSLFTYLTYLIKGYENKFGEVIKSKNNAASSDDDKPVIDRIRSAQKESIGDMAIYPTYLKERRFVVEDIDPDISDEVFALMNQTTVHKTEEFQKYLAQFVLSLVMSPVGLNLMVARRTLNGSATVDRPYAQVVSNPMHDALIITRIVLWGWGFKALALLVTAKRHVSEEFIGIESTDRISRNTVDALMEKYPHAINKVSNDRQRNVPYVAIMKVVKNIGQSSWEVDYPNELASEVSDYLDVGGRLRVPNDIAEQLSQVLLKITEIKRVRYIASGGK